MTGDNNGSGSNQPDYAARDLPDQAEVPYDEWGWRDRRAYLYREWLDLGSHQLMNKTQLAEQFGVSRETLYNDLDRIAEKVEAELGEGHQAQAVTTFQAAVRELLDQGEYEKAARVQNMMSDWLERRGAIEKEPDRLVTADAADASELDEDDVEWLNEVF